MFINIARSHHSLKTVIACASFGMVAQICACSTAADGGSQETDSGGPAYNPPDFDQEPQGRVVRCAEDQYVCLERGPARCHLFQSPEPHILYLAAMCAATFSGDIDDYWDAHVSRTYVTNYPHIGEASWEDCDLGFDHVNWEYESPALANRSVFYEGTIPLTCDHSSYCSWLDAAMEAFPDSVTLAPDPICNVAPDGDDSNLSERPFQCVGSADQACGTVYRNGVPDEVCPIDNVSWTVAPGTDICVLATSASDAAFECQAQCLGEHLGYLAQDENGELDYPLQDYLDCDYDNLVWVSDVDAQCAWVPPHPGGVYTVAMPEPFDFAVSLVTDGGLSTVSDDKVALLEYSIGACSNGECPITIGSVYLPNQTYSGSMVDAAGAYPYDLGGLGVRLVAPVVGVVAQSDGAVTFPSAAFDLVVSTGPISFNNLSLDPVQNLALSITQIDGFVRNGKLTLNATYATIDAELSVTLSER